MTTAADTSPQAASVTRTGPLSLGEILAEFQVEAAAVEDCDHVDTGRTQKFNGGAGAHLCATCRHIVSYGFHPSPETQTQTEIQTETPEGAHA